MKTNSHDEHEDHNLVMFPSAKNFKVALSSAELGPDPLQDLLNEYSDLADEDIPFHLDERFEYDSGSELDSDSFDSLEAFMSRNLRGEAQGPDDRFIKAINDQIEAIMEAKERIKFYLAEIEMLAPLRRK